MPINVQCKRCAHLKNDWCEPKKDSPDPDILCICQFYREKTNADRLRAMSDEKLVDYICCPWTQCVSLQGECDECILNWLKSPVNGGENDA